MFRLCGRLVTSPCPVLGGGEGVAPWQHVTCITHDSSRKACHHASGTVLGGAYNSPDRNHVSTVVTVRGSFKKVGLGGHFVDRAKMATCLEAMSMKHQKPWQLLDLVFYDP